MLLLFGYGTLIHQGVVVDPDRVFHDGSKGNGLIGALAKLLNGTDQFHRVRREADAELFGGIGMIFCHWDLFSAEGNCARGVAVGGDQNG